MASRLGFVLAISLMAALAWCQDGAASQARATIKWDATLASPTITPGSHTEVILTATTKPGWHIYDVDHHGDWVSTGVKIKDGQSLKANGKMLQPDPLIKFDDGFKASLGTFEGQAAFGVPVDVTATAPGPQKATLDVTYQTCDAHSCLAPDTIQIPVSFTVAAGAAVAGTDSIPLQPAGYVKPAPAATAPVAAATSSAPGIDAQADAIKTAAKAGLGPFLLLSFTAGLLALLTPCVWPMIPITVSFFSKKKQENAKPNLAGALWYCLGIMSTFVALGIVTTLLFKASGIQMIAANPWVNAGLGVLFVVLALNLFGVFEIIIPQSVVGKAQKGTKVGGIVGPLLMGLVFSLTSFTCTVPFVGTLLVSASTGNLLYPILGMLAFSAAFALPFFFLALFPGLMGKLPRAGSWLVDVKAYLGFLELAAALKFFSNLDVTVRATPLGLLPRETFLGVWAAIMTVAALFLMGWIRLGKEGGGTKPGIFRYAIGLANIAAAVYLFAAVGGHAPLGSLAGFLPPYSTGQTIDSLAWKSDLPAGTAEAQADHKLIFINFTGVTCTNCRVMEQNVFPTGEVKSELGKFARVELYTDRPSASDQANAALREDLTHSATNPVYVVMTTDRKVLGIQQGLSSKDEFLTFLHQAESKNL